MKSTYDAAQEHSFLHKIGVCFHNSPSSLSFETRYYPYRPIRAMQHSESATVSSGLHEVGVLPNIETRRVSQAGKTLSPRDLAVIADRYVLDLLLRMEVASDTKRYNPCHIVFDNLKHDGPIKMFANPETIPYVYHYIDYQDCEYVVVRCDEMPTGYALYGEPLAIHVADNPTGWHISGINISGAFSRSVAFDLPFITALRVAVPRR